MVTNVFELLTEFIGNLDINYDRDFGSWFGGLRSNDRVAVDKIEKKLRQNGFNGRRTAVLKTPEGTCIYGVENQNGFDSCAPCYTPGKQARTPMVEGNALVGLLVASKSPKLKQLVRASGTSLARVLVPVQADEEPTCSLNPNSTEMFIFKYRSSAASIQISYEYDPSKNRGFTAILVENSRLEFEDYAEVYL
ncbi:MAG: hypothetical protein F6J93_29390 [Oscillatoria sp. SIO1A7]|nr:hypothetical protein [Oscillatoria sp. SIO1A7]